MILQPILLNFGLEDPIVAEEDVAESMAGRAFRTGEPVTAQRNDGVRVWIPLVERGERTGVVAMTLPAIDDSTMPECVRVGLFAGLLVRGFARTTDLMHLRRRGRPMSLAAGMQWDLLPPLTIRCAQAVACGRLEPAYEIAGDAFDYAINSPNLDVALFDGMGHGVESTMMTTVAIGAYRHARRSGDPPAMSYTAIDQAITGQYDGDAFVTALLARLSLDSGLLEWVSAGHPAPLLCRTGRVVGELECTPSLPLGLGGACQQVATVALQPGDHVLLFTDGVIEGRSIEGAEFGVERLAQLWEQQANTDRPPEEVLRQLVAEIVGHSAGRLRDDATLLQITWQGPKRGVARSDAGSGPG